MQVYGAKREGKRKLRTADKEEYLSCQKAKT